MDGEKDKVMTRKRKSTQQTGYDDADNLELRIKGAEIEESTMKPCLRVMELNRREIYLDEKEVEIEQCHRELKDKQARFEKKLKDFEGAKKDFEEAAKKKKLTQEVTDQIECPVCLEVPRIGPVPVCPNGHLVCKSCKTASCPTCRTAMGKGNSLLAVTILENIDHRCKLQDCELEFPLHEIEKHESGCKHRIVACPKKKCQAKVPLLKLVQHLLGSEDCCFQTEEPRKVLDGVWNTEHFSVPNIEKLTKNWSMDLYSLNEEVFGVFPNKEGQFNFVLVMFNSEKDCSKYKFEIVVHGEKSVEEAETVSRFEGNPVSIDVMQEERNLYVTSEQLMRKILSKSSNQDSFGLSFKITKK